MSNHEAPKPPTSATSARRPSAAVGPAAAVQVRVILIEDNPDDAFLVQEMLRADGEQFDFHHATTLGEAMAIIPPIDTPTCVLLDLSLPDSDGLESVEALTRFAPHAPIVVLTGYEDDSVCFRALASGAQDYIVKRRLSAEVLVRAIRYALQSKSSQDALFDVGERFRLAFESSPMGIALISARREEEGTIVDANPAFATMLGSGLDAAIGESFFSFLHPDDIATTALEFRALLAGRKVRWQGRQRLLHPSGGEILCSVTASLMRDIAGQPSCVVGMFEDIGEEARREEELAQALDALDNVAYGIARLNLAGEFVSLNRAYAATVGYPDGDLIGRPWASVIDPSDHELARRTFAQASPQQPGRAELCGRRRDGTAFDAEIAIVPCCDKTGATTGVLYFLRDISERKASERALQTSEDRYRKIVETANEGVWILDAAGITAFVNAKFCEMMGCAEADLLGRPASDLILAEDCAVFESVLRAGDRASKPVDVRLRRDDGIVWALIAASPQEHTGAEHETLAMVTDITDRKQVELELAQMALHDHLTGLPNRALLIDRLRHALRQAERRSSTVGVFFIDLDRFKEINDTMGHDAGDALIQAIVPRLSETLRSGDTLARFGGDEFVVLCPDLTGEEDARVIVNRLYEALRPPIVIRGTAVSPRASIGIAFSRNRESTAEDMIRDADTAMYKAKARGGGSYDVFNSTMRADVVAKLRIEQDIREALRRNQFSLVYQPILAMDDRTVSGCEALIRWQHPERGPISPGEFIPQAESNGLIDEIGDWVLEEACRQLAIWSASHSRLEHVNMWINVSARQFSDPGFPHRAQEIIRRHGVSPARLRFEITETALIDLDAKVATTVMTELRELGIDLVLDDFGTEYSSLNYLRRLPLVGLKLDRSFVSQIDSDHAIAPIITAVSAMAHALGLSLVAEGIETPAQLTAVQAYGCDLAQGFLLARPMDAAGVEAWLRERPPGAPIEASAARATNTIGLKEAAARLGVSLSTLRRWADSGRLASVRTPGGHRRLLADSVAREAKRQSPAVRLNTTPVPTAALPEITAALEQGDGELLDLAARRVYAAGTPGWFTTSDGRTARGAWRSALAAGCAQGDYSSVIEATTGFFRRAMLSGVSSLERHLFLSQFRVALLAALQRTGTTERVLISSRRLMLAIEHSVMDLACT